MTQETTEEILEEEDDSETSSEGPKLPPVVQKVSRFGPQAGSKFGKGATNFSPPNKQRPGRAAGRGR